MNYRQLKSFVFPAFLLALSPMSVSAQGPLTPPGAPGAVMKTLDQVEPRIPISGTTNITRSGSYYLTTNLTGISISSGNVVLDLMGYSIAATGGSAVYFYGAYTNVVIRNGTLSSAVGNGVQCAFATANARGLIEQVRIQNCSGIGLNLPAGYIVRDCEIYGCSSGIQAAGAIEVRNCRLELNGTALILTSNSTVVANTLIKNTGDGLHLTGTGSYVADNIVKGNGDNYDITDGNQLNLLLCEIPETIDWPCSVKLAGTLTCSLAGSNGVTVYADNVTIDMDGHTLIGAGTGSGSGILQLYPRCNLKVFNGKVINWRGNGACGICADGLSSILSGLQSTTNTTGFRTGIGGTLSDCTAQYSSGYGIDADHGSSLRDCVARYNGSIGIQVYGGGLLHHCLTAYNGNGFFAGGGSTISDCSAYENTGWGILTGLGCVVSQCATWENGSYGIKGDDGSLITSCTAQFNVGDGILIAGNTTVSHCVVDYNGWNSGNSAGIHATGSGNRIEENHATRNDRGLDVDVAGNFIERNIAKGNTLNWDIAAGNACLVVQAVNAGAISGNAGGVSPGSTDPKANFTY